MILTVNSQRDPIDDLVDQWRAERPDLKPDVMGVFGRFGRIYALAVRSIEATLEPWGLQMGEFDVLATLRRSGAPFTLAPSALTRWLMSSPSGITSRLDRLEKLGFIERRASPDDRRSLLVVLTAPGRKVIDDAVTAHVANETRLLSGISASERKTLDQVLRVLLRSLEAAESEPGPERAAACRTTAPPARRRR
jgi:DNA-binding MarR family transcriptional regulator